MHSHIVPGVDDGARTYSEATEMICRMRDKLEINSTIVFTPHYSSSMSERIVHARSEQANLFQDRIEEEFPEGLSFLTAGELMVQGHFLRHIEQVRYPGTGWVLVEFSTGVTWTETLIQVRRIISRGYNPLIAHPERYRWCRRKRSRLIKLSKIGCGVLVSARSFSFEKYAATARNLLRDGLCHAICSDAHSSSDYILDGRLKKKLEDFSRIPWAVVTRTMPELILNDMKLPELPLLEQKKVL